MQLSDELLRKWEHIIADVNKTEVPLECLKKVTIKLTGGRQKTINLQTLRKQGLDEIEIESVLTRTLNELDSSIRDVDFVVDIGAVSEMVHPETDKLLGRL
jgi:hypothetical protein